MARLIDAEALKKAIQEKEGVNNETWEQLYDSVLEEIDNAPSVDVSSYASKQRAYKEGKYDGFMSSPYGDD